MGIVDKKIFVVVLRYIVDTDIVEGWRSQHLAWLDKQYRVGTVFVSGPQIPGFGGLIIAHTESRAEFMDILAEDPFSIHRCAEYQVFEFTPTRSSPNFATFMAGLGDGAY